MSLGLTIVVIAAHLLVFAGLILKPLHTVGLRPEKCIADKPTRSARVAGWWTKVSGWVPVWGRKAGVEPPHRRSQRSRFSGPVRYKRAQDRGAKRRQQKDRPPTATAPTPRSSHMHSSNTEGIATNANQAGVIEREREKERSPNRRNKPLRPRPRSSGNRHLPKASGPPSRAASGGPACNPCTWDTKRTAPPPPNTHQATGRCGGGLGRCLGQRKRAGVARCTAWVHHRRATGPRRYRSRRQGRGSRREGLEDECMVDELMVGRVLGAATSLAPLDLSGG